jgi:hypothetical protein
MQVNRAMRLITVQVKGNSHHRNLDQYEGRQHVTPETQIQQAVEKLHIYFRFKEETAL